MISLPSPDGERRLLRQALKVGWGSNRDHWTAPELHCKPSQLAIHFHTNDMIFSAAFFRKEADRERVGNGIRNLREPSVHLRLSP